jgi:hypothetical protein
MVVKRYCLSGRCWVIADGSRKSVCEDAGWGMGCVHLAMHLRIGSFGSVVNSICTVCTLLQPCLARCSTARTFADLALVDSWIDLRMRE